MERNEKIRKLLIEHCQSYPKLQIQDVFKFLYQSAFGCEHLVSSLENVTEYIKKEFDNISHDSELTIQQLAGGYCRVPLAYLDQGLSANTLGKLFFFSAKKESAGLADLLEMLKIARELVCENKLPFAQKEFETAAAEWESCGYLAVHHSDCFRETYLPSYRVIANRYIPYLPLFAEIDMRLAKGSLKVAIEGGSASGKTMLSVILEDIYDCTVFHMDDFFLRTEQRTPGRYAEVGGNVDRERFRKEVLQPLKRGENVEYRRFDCASMQLMDAVQISPKELIVIEGVYSMHPELAGYYDYSVFLDVSPKLQKERIEQRNSLQLTKRFFDEWIPLERKYFSEMSIREKCDLQITVI